VTQQGQVIVAKIYYWPTTT